MSRQSISSFLPQPKKVEKEAPQYVEEGTSDIIIPSSTSLTVKPPPSTIIKAKTSTTLEVRTDKNGSIDYSNIIAKQGHNSNRIIQTSYTDLIPLRQRARAGEISLEKPSKEEVTATTEKTKAAIDKILTGKIESSKPQSIVKKANEPTYVRYTPSNSLSSNGNGKQRIIKMVDVAQDPLAPPKFKHTKVPGGPPSPPPPVLRSPPRKLTAKDQEDWYIPPSISNWKNPKGFTIALDKRVAADGRGLQEATINDNMAKLSEALYAADRSAREEIRQRSAMQQKLAERENALKEERLRKLAEKAREERAKIREPPRERSVTPDRIRSSAREKSRSPSYSRERSRSPPSTRNRSYSRSPETSAERERERIRYERRKEAERELRLSRMGNERKIKALARDRDISERVALGIAKPTKPTGESQFDARLFSQTSNSGGLSGSGYSEDQVYDKSLFSAQEAIRSIYRPRGNTTATSAEDDEESELDRIKGEKRFEGLGVRPGEEPTSNREGPVEFIKDTTTTTSTTTDDPFGIDEMVSQVKKTTKYGLN